MADLNGFEATRRLGADEATAAIPVIAVSASAWDEVRQAARDAGCVDFLPKPVRADVLFARLQRYTGARFVSPAGETDAALRPPLGDRRRRARPRRRAFARRPRSATSPISTRSPHELVERRRARPARSAAASRR